VRGLFKKTVPSESEMIKREPKEKKVPVVSLPRQTTEERQGVVIEIQSEGTGDANEIENTDKSAPDQDEVEISFKLV
jgi:hypothetical protein